MTQVTRRALMAFSLLGAFGMRASYSAEPGPRPLPPTLRSCVVPFFDLLAYTGKPDLRQLGIKPIRIFSVQHLWGENESRDAVPPATSMARGLRRQPPNDGPVVLDIEHWPFRGSDAEVTATLERLLALLARVREQEPAAAVGFYSIPPIRDYWRSLRASGTPERTQWQRENDHFRPLAQAVDIAYPSLYTFYDDVEGWRRYAIANLTEARRLGSRRIYPFLWPQYHNSNKTLGGQYLNGSFWRTQLEVATMYADGIVLWGGWGPKGPMQWDDSAPWWNATRQFIANRAADVCP
jgi:hypothetical protein